MFVVSIFHALFIRQNRRPSQNAMRLLCMSVMAVTESIKVAEMSQTASLALEQPKRSEIWELFARILTSGLVVAWNVLSYKLDDV